MKLLIKKDLAYQIGISFMACLAVIGFSMYWDLKQEILFPKNASLRTFDLGPIVCFVEMNSKSLSCLRKE